MGFIYLMTNKVNGLQYIGQTSLTIAARMAGHKHEAKVCKPDVYFVRAMHKYGFENFDIKVLEECPDEELDNREIYWIEEYDTFLGPGYNSVRGGEGNKKFLNTDILEMWNAGHTRKEIAEKLNCHPATVTNGLRALGILEEEIRKRGQSLICKKKEVLQYDLQGNLISKFSCVDEAAEAIGHHPGTIRQVCNHHAHTAFGYIWCHSDEQKTIQQLIEEIPISKRNRPVSCYDLNGNFIQNYSSCAEAGRKLNINSYNIEAAARKENLSCNGYLWKYNDDLSDIIERVNAYEARKNYKKIKVDQYDLYNNYIKTFSSAKEAAQSIGKKNGASSITKACRGKLKTAYKYIWKYHEKQFD